MKIKVKAGLFSFRLHFWFLFIDVNVFAEKSRAEETPLDQLSVIGYIVRNSNVRI